MIPVIFTITIIVLLIIFLIVRANRLNLPKRTLSIAENDALQEDYVSHGSRKNIEDSKNL